MSFANDLTQIGVLRVVVAQVALTVISGLAAYIMFGNKPMLAAIYGGMIVIVSSWWMANRLLRATEIMMAPKEPEEPVVDADSTMGMGSLILFAGLVQRLLFIGVAFAYGIGYIKLPALPMIVTFAVASIGYVFVGRR